MTIPEIENNEQHNKFKFTYHLRERYRARILHPKNKNISAKEMDSMIGKEINGAVENKAVWNNTGFTTYIFERYGVEDYHFLTSDNTIFVTIKKVGGPWTVVTCYPRKDPLVNHFAKTHSY